MVKKKNIWKILVICISCLVFLSLSFIVIFPDVVISYKRVTFGNYGSFKIPDNWVITNTSEGVVISNRPLDDTDSVILAIQDTSVRCGEYYCQNSKYMGDLVIKNAKPGGKSLSGSNDVVSCEIIIEVNGMPKDFYSIYLVNGFILTFISEKVSWSKVVRIAESFKP